MDRDLDYAPIEDRLIVTDLGKEKYLATPEKDRQMEDKIYLSLHYGPQWKQKHKVLLRSFPLIFFLSIEANLLRLRQCNYL
ncbi:hypothetical protein C5167_004241 [Papaver somniferum]|nr:hypothetical protein C5167_004241 [Papaver somniferum]